MFLLFLAQAVRAAAVEETKHQEVVVEVIVVLLVDTKRILGPRSMLLHSIKCLIDLRN